MTMVGFVEAPPGRSRAVEASRRRHTHLSVIGQFLGPAPSTFTQVAFGDCLEPPGNSANQVRLVSCPGCLAEQLGIPLAKLPDAHRTQGSHLLLDINSHWTPFWFSVTLTPGYAQTH